VPVEAKPIFRPDVIRLPILGFSLPEAVVQRRPKLERWAEIIATGSVDAHKEAQAQQSCHQGPFGLRRRQ